MGFKQFVAGSLFSILMATGYNSVYAQEAPKINNIPSASVEVNRLMDAVYCLRKRAIYKRVGFTDSSQELRLSEQSTDYGTGIAFKRINGYTYLLTNEHVAENQDVRNTGFLAIHGDIGNSILTNQRLEIVDNHKDTFPNDDIQLEIVATNAASDVSLLRTKAEIPFYDLQTISRGSLIVGDTVVLVGFPLAVTKAFTRGSVSNPTHKHIHNDQGDNIHWDHDDFMIDAASNPGNSGGPAFIIRDGEYHFAGLLHAGYGGFIQAEGMKLVVSVDEFADLMNVEEPLEDENTQQQEIVTSDDLEERVAHLGESEFNRLFKFGYNTSTIDVNGDSIRFTIYTENFLGLGERADPIILEDNGQGGYLGFDSVEYHTQGKVTRLTSDEFDVNQAV